MECRDTLNGRLISKGDCAAFKESIFHLRHNTTGPDRCSFTDVYARQNDNVTPKPAVLSDMNLLSKLWAGDPVSQRRVERVSAAIEATIWPDHCTSTNSDETCVYDDGIKVEKRSFTKSDVCSIVHPDGPIDPWILLEELLVQFWCCRWRG